MNAGETATLAALWMSCGALLPLAPWEPVGSALSQVQEALSGAGSIDPRTVRRLAAWGVRWRALSPRVRDFYVAEVSDYGADLGAVEAALWAILRGTTRTLSPRQRGSVRARWTSRYGSEPDVDLFPDLRRRTT